MSLARADRPLADVLGVFASHGIEVGLLVPTPTGLDKSIMDAHAGLREFLKAKGLHDYGAQRQGTANRVLLRAWFVSQGGLRETKASLYRPETKVGDPRIWVHGLATCAKAGNVLALLGGDDGLYVVNGSDEALMASAGDPSSVLGSLLARLSPRVNPAAEELLGKLREVGSRGFVRTLRPGPTGVGFTLESLLDIPANSRRAPDFKGIAIMASRTRGGGAPATRTTLFSKTPDWRASRYSALGLVQAYGRPNDQGRKQIYCSLRNQPNATFGFYLATEDQEDLLHTLRGTPGHAPAVGDAKLLEWSLATLRSTLVAKHRETFWVKARVRGTGAEESFQYFEAAHTLAPMQANLAPLIDSGHVELDFLLHLTGAPEGKQRTRDHGYLFKMWDRHRHLLFAEPRVYSLAS